MSYPIRKIVTAQIDPQLSAEDWQLYTSAMDCTAVATELNRVLKFYFNTGCGRREVCAAMRSIMQSYAKFGACDTEPEAVLDAILDDLYRPAP